MAQWYYVEGSERIGPMEQTALENLIALGTLNLESYVWRKGFPNWVKVKDIEELAVHTESSDAHSNADDVAESGSAKSDKRERRTHSTEQAQIYDKEIKVENIQSRQINLKNISSLDKEFYIKIGADREESVEVEYGPYALDELKKMFAQKRINEKTFIATINADKWVTLADFDLVEKITDTRLIKPHLTTNDPVFLRALVDGEVAEGIVRDLSLGGGQFLTKEILPLQKKLKANLVWGNRKAIGVHFIVTRRLEDKSGYVVRFITLTSNLRALIENVFQLE
ncbi:MAG: DUF4339 domain-containing protein [Bacteriovoracaceae bacterium]|nr:DUF4339 domain-containing protein [Bacteriovoracaceae bacterium]